MLIINIYNRYEVQFLLRAVYFWAHMNIEHWIVMFDKVLCSLLVSFQHVIFYEDLFQFLMFPVLKLLDTIQYLVNMRILECQISRTSYGMSVNPV